MNIDYEEIKVIPANKDDKAHKKGIWFIKNENLDFSLISDEKISYKQHNNWWKGIFEIEYIYIILYKSEVSGYIRLTKLRTKSKEEHEISIAIAKKYQNIGFGTYALKIFEKKMRKIGIHQIIAFTHFNNELGQKFFEKNRFNKTYLRYVKKI